MPHITLPGAVARSKGQCNNGECMVSNPDVREPWVDKYVPGRMATSLTPSLSGPKDYCGFGQAEPPLDTKDKGDKWCCRDANASRMTTHCNDPDFASEGSRGPAFAAVHRFSKDYHEFLHGWMEAWWWSSVMGHPQKLKFLSGFTGSARAQGFVTTVTRTGKTGTVNQNEMKCANMSWGALCGFMYPEAISPPPRPPYHPSPSKPPQMPPAPPSMAMPPSPLQPFPSQPIFGDVCESVDFTYESLGVYQGGWRFQSAHHGISAKATRLDGFYRLSVSPQSTNKGGQWRAVFQHSFNKDRRKYRLSWRMRVEKEQRYCLAYMCCGEDDWKLSNCMTYTSLWQRGSLEFETIGDEDSVKFFLGSFDNTVDISDLLLECIPTPSPPMTPLPLAPPPPRWPPHQPPVSALSVSNHPPKWPPHPPSPMPLPPPPPPGPPAPPCVDTKPEMFCLKQQGRGKCATDLVVQAYCPRTCGICSDAEYICADLTYHKDECAVRKSEGQCKRKGIRNKCRVTCATCTPEEDSPLVCADRWHSRYCQNQKNKNKCETDETVSMKCERTCGHCQKARCVNFGPDDTCNKWAKDGECSNSVVQAKCRKACNLCGVWDVQYDIYKP